MLLPYSLGGDEETGAVRFRGQRLKRYTQGIAAAAVERTDGDGNGVSLGIRFRPEVGRSRRCRRRILEMGFRRGEERLLRRGNGRRWCSVRFRRGKVSKGLFCRLLRRRRRRRAERNAEVRRRIWRRRPS